MVSAYAEQCLAQANSPVGGEDVWNNVVEICRTNDRDAQTWTGRLRLSNYDSAYERLHARR